MEMQNSEINDFLFDAGSWNPMRTKSKEPKKKKIETHEQGVSDSSIFNIYKKLNKVFRIRCDFSSAAHELKKIL